MLLKNKNIKNDIYNWYLNFEFYRPLFFTGVLDNETGFSHSKFIYEIITNNIHRFIRNIHSLSYKKSKFEIQRIVIIEKGKTRYHTHIIIETPIHLNVWKFIDVLSTSWRNTRHGVSSQTDKIYDYENLANYLSKEVYLNSVTGINWENCHRTIS